MKQGDSEEVADFLVKVTNAVNGLAKNWKGHLTEEELDTLQYEVFLNGVKKEIHHVLDAEAVKHPHMTPDQMYTAVRRFESYVARNERLDGKEATPTRAKAPKASSHAAPHYKHRFHKTTPSRLWQLLCLKRRALDQSPQVERGQKNLRMLRKTRQVCSYLNSSETHLTVIGDCMSGWNKPCKPRRNG